MHETLGRVQDVLWPDEMMRSCASKLAGTDCLQDAQLKLEARVIALRASVINGIDFADLVLVSAIESPAELG